MGDSEETRSGCLKRGCLGCTAVLALLLLAVLALFLAGRFLTPEVAPRQAELAPEHPALRAPTAEDEPRPRRGTLSLRVEEASVVLQPAPAGSRLRVEASYDSGAYELSEIEDRSDDGDWSYQVSFRSTLGWLGIFRESGEDNRLVVHVPADLPIDLEADVRRGDAQFQLGTLDLRSASMEWHQGDFLLDVAEPTLRPMERLTVRGSMAGLMLTGLGNASPREVRVEARMAGLEVELSGPWRTESDLEVSFRMGGCLVSAPLDAPLVVEQAHVDGGDVDLRVPDRAEEQPPPARAVRLSATGSLGGLVIRQP